MSMWRPRVRHTTRTTVDTRWVEPIVPLHGGYPLHPSSAGMDGMAHVLERAIGGSNPH